MIALPVPIVSENFSLFYKQERRRRMVQERRAALEKAHMEGRVMDYGAVREDKAAQIIQERWGSGWLAGWRESFSTFLILIF